MANIFIDELLPLDIVHCISGAVTGRAKGCRFFEARRVSIASEKGPAFSVDKAKSNGAEKTRPLSLLSACFASASCSEVSRAA
jgi:hypothetical protein